MPEFFDILFLQKTGNSKKIVFEKLAVFLAGKNQVFFNSVVL